METSEAIALLQQALGKIERLRGLRVNSPDHIAFVQSTNLELTRIFGQDSLIRKNFSRITYVFVGQLLVHSWNSESELANAHQKEYLAGLDRAEGVLRSAMEQLRKYGVEKVINQNDKSQNYRGRVFISHGSQTNALTKIEHFIRALGLEPVIVMREASLGMSVDDLVNSKMDESDCTIILATADEIIGERKQPRPNVIHEIGLAQEKFPHKVIYLKEEGCEFPSNVRPKVWENFTQDNMEVAFEKIGKELHAFGLI